jgi:NAD(P)H-dependent FMN reductase
VASQFENASVKVLDLNDYDLPVFTVDLEEKIGHPEPAQKFVKDLEGADLLIISFAEYNGSYASGFKNIFDWASRVKLQVFDTKVFLLATATGAGGGRYVLENAVNRFPRHGAEILATFYLPFFYQNFDSQQGITHPEFREMFESALQEVKNKLL